MPQKYRFLDPEGLIQPPRAGQRFDCVVAADAASFERLGRAGECLGERQTLINIDHHPCNTRFGDINWVAAKTSTGELIYRLLRAARWPITRALPIACSRHLHGHRSFQYPPRASTYHVAGNWSPARNLTQICHEVYQSFPCPARVC